jgi:hypothetical protein
MGIPESNIASMLKSIDDKGAHHIKREYLTIDILDNSYKYSHNGLGYMVINSATEREHFITISNEIASCTCSTFLQYQLPCRHLLFVMKSVINLKPYVAPRWIKQFMVSKVSDREYSESISTQLQESTETNIWNQMGESIHSTNHTSKLIIQTQSEKYNSLKVIFDQISALLCLSGQKEFNRNLAILEKYLVALQLNKSLEPFDPRNVDDQYLNDGQGNIYPIDIDVRVAKTTTRRGRSKGAAAPFGCFATRGGVQGRGKTKSSITISKLRSQSDDARPKRGPGSRGGKGAYNKKLKTHEVQNNLQPVLSTDSESSRSPTKKKIILNYEDE